MKNNAKTSSDKWLWNDPLELELGKGGVLLADSIRQYIREYNLLIDNDFNPKHLKGASYSMSPADNNGWWIDGKENIIRLQIESDGNKRRYYRVPQNSLVYIGLKEHLRLPFYIIGRHNLKIRYIYQGVLLGTAPQVDPGYFGRLYIPLHNLTNKDVKVYLDESFVSIDFVRTTPLKLDKGEPRDINEFYSLYDHLAPIKRKKIERHLLEDYLDDNRPCSSLSGLVQRLEKQSDEFSRRKIIDIVAFVGIVTVVIAAVGACIAYALPMEQRVDALAKDTYQPNPNMLILDDHDKLLNRKAEELDDRINALQKQVDDLKVSNASTAKH